jgi:hypothetical protein
MLFLESNSIAPCPLAESDEHLIITTCKRSSHKPRSPAFVMCPARWCTLGVREALVATESGEVHASAAPRCSRGAVPGGQADILDRNSVDREAGWLVRLVRRLCGYNIALALLGYQRCYQYDAVFSHSELVALPFAFLIRPRSRRPRHVTTAYYLTGRRNALLYRLLGVHRGIDTIFTLSREQFETGRQLKIPEKKTRTPLVVRLCRCQVLRYRDGTSCR